MKKIIALILFSGFLSFCCNSQNIVQISNDGNKNSNSNQQKECEYKINGICSTEDIGGVDVEIIKEEVTPAPDYYKYRFDIYAVFTNYNNSAVTVLYEIGTASEVYYYKDYPPVQSGQTGSIVLPPGSSKKIKLQSKGLESSDQAFFMKGLIVRKLQ